jgi:putative salt-induced outer membrane protein YdiY
MPFVSRMCRFLCLALAVTAAAWTGRLQAGGIDFDSAIPASEGTKVWANRSIVVDPALPMPRGDELPSFFPLNELGPIQTGDGFSQELLPAMFTDAGDPGFYPEEPGLPEAAIINDSSLVSSPTFGDRLWNDFSDGFLEWTSRISLGARSLSGNSKQNFIDFAADFEKKEETRATQINLQGQFGESENKVVANRWFANSTTDFYRGDQWLLFAKLMDQYDQLQNLDYRGTFSAGVGYRFFFEESRRFIVRLGPGVTTEFFHNPSDNRTTPDIFSEVEIRLPIWDRLKWEQKTTVFPSLSELAVARAQSQTSFLYAFDEKERWSLKVGFQYQYISEPNPGRLPNDFTTNLSIVYLRK